MSIRDLSGWIGIPLLIVFAAFSPVVLSASSQSPSEVSGHRTLLDTYCVTCHNAQLRTAEVLLDEADLEAVGKNTDLWRRVTMMLQAGAMPPAGMPRPEQSSVDAFLAYLEEGLANAPAQTTAEVAAVNRSSEQAVAPSSDNLAPAHGSGYRGLLDRYCVTCHNQQLRTGEMVLSGVNVDAVGEAGEVWEKVVHKLRSGAMPPVGMPRPDEATLNDFAEYLESELDQVARANPNPGKKAVAHRLNRAEYTNAIRDLLALEIDGAELLPADDSGGFDNLGDLLSVSPLLMEKYMSAAYKISRLAVGDLSIRPDSRTHTVSPFLLQNERMSEDLPFGSRGGVALRHHFPLDAEYVVNVRLQRTDSSSFVVGIAEPSQLDVRLDGARVKLLTVGGKHVGKALGPDPADMVPPDFNQAQYERNADAELEVRFDAPAGTHLLQIAFLEENSVPEGVFPRRSQSTYEDARIEEEHARGFVDPAISNISIKGPFNPSGRGETPSLKRIFVCRPAGTDSEEPCARTILSKLARRAYRRAVTDTEVGLLMDLYREGRTQGSFEAGIQMALEGLLVSTEFLFRIEEDPEGVSPGESYRLSDLALASRLSFFIWSSIPDDELLDVAEAGKLKDPAILEQQVRRMLADPRSKALVDNFTGQWLVLRNLSKANPNRDVFASFDESLREAFQTETSLFLESLVREDRSVLDMLRADYTFLNERLAKHYGIPDVYGSKFRRVTLEDENRRGLLGHGSVLTITALSNRTSAVMRGKWVLENILASPPPEPPVDVPPLSDKGASGENLTMRQQMEQHRANPACQGCHSKMDPIGFALENFDAVGQWRDIDNGLPIDPSGVFPDGSEFEGPSGLREVLLSRPELIANAVGQKLLTYALGRTLEYYDASEVRKIVRGAASDDYRWSSIVLGIVKSTPFQMRRSQTS